LAEASNFTIISILAQKIRCLPKINKKLELAEQLGANRTINSIKTNLEKEIKKILGRTL